MELSLPMSYIELHQEEMMNLDGGDANNFARNVTGMLERFAISTTLRRNWGIPSTATMATWGYWTAVSVFPGAMAKIAAFTANPVVVGIAALGGVAAVTYLWNVRVFY